MRKTKKMIAFLVIMVMMIAINPLRVVNAAITDPEDLESNILRKTTTNYHTTVKLEGTLYNEITDKTLTLNKTSEETDGNIDDEAVASIIASFKNEFNTWANENKATKVDNPNEEVSDYYYDAHDEITQTSENGDSDVILVGDINDLDSAYTAQGKITIETILDKHQTYTIKMNATIEDKGIKSVNITLEAPIVGEKVTSTLVGDENMGYFEQDNTPVAKTSDNITIDETAWIKGTYPVVGDDYMDYISTTFEKNTYYYAMISISAKSGYTLNNDLSIKVNGETPAEVFTVYNNDNTYFIAKIKAVEKATEEPKDEKATYKVLEGSNQTVDIGKDEELTFKFNIEYSDFLASGKVYVDSTEVASTNYTSKEGSTIVTFNDEYTKSLSTGEHTIKVVVADGEANTKFTIAKTETTANIEKANENATKTEVTTNNPQTGDNIIVFIAVFAIAILGVFAVIKFNKNKKVK